jgi:hypothetical protein
MDEVEPNFGLQQDAYLRFEVVKEALDGERIIIGQIDAYHFVAIQLFTCGAASGGGVCEQYLMLGILHAKATDEGCGGTSLANGDGMEPDDGFVGSKGVATETFGHMA